MNSLNILSARVSPPQTPAPSRTNSLGNILTSGTLTESRRSSRDDIFREKTESSNDDVDNEKNDYKILNKGNALLESYDTPSRESRRYSWLSLPGIITSIVMGSIRWGLTTLASPGVYLIACLYDDRGVFAPFSQIWKFKNIFSRSGSYQSATRIPGDSRLDHESRKSQKSPPSRRMSTRSSRSPSPSGMSSESESERDRTMSEAEQSGSGRITRSKAMQSSSDITPARRSISIKISSDDSVRQRKHRKAQAAESDGSGGISTGVISPAALKSPTSPAASLLMTKYPRTPAPPRPLVPRRQPSYTLPDVPSGGHYRKTLIIDLDETLIHSMAKGGRMSTGHMVEVKLNTLVGAGNNASLGPQHPILYYVHKRPHCDDFLRRVCKWYNLVVFTASVQEYADPVIDWLEQERKFFSHRYYRQHCTYRHGAFIKDLSSVEPDLSKVMILDNSPLSYMFHQDNAIPIEGWINDPTDNDLLHLVPLLEGLQYVTDVRAFLALRGGEDGRHMA